MRPVALAALDSSASLAGRVCSIRLGLLLGGISSAQELDFSVSCLHTYFQVADGGFVLRTHVCQEKI